MKLRRSQIFKRIEIGGVHRFPVVDRSTNKFVLLLDFIRRGTAGCFQLSMSDSVFLLERYLDTEINNKVLTVPVAPS